jgi:hypothetical protein
VREVLIDVFDHPLCLGVKTLDVCSDDRRVELATFFTGEPLAEGVVSVGFGLAALLVELRGAMHGGGKQLVLLEGLAAFARQQHAGAAVMGTHGV